MFCYKCGTKLPDDAKFCQNCGAQVQTGVASPPPAPPLAPQPVQQPEIKIPPAPPVPPAPAPQPRPYAGPYGAQPPQAYPPKKQKLPNWAIPVIVVGAVVGLVVMIAVGSAIYRWITGENRGSAPHESSSPPNVEMVTPSPEPQSESEPAEDGGSFLHYENKEVKFAIDYPEGFELSEPNANNVLIGSGDQCRVAVEYAFSTVGDCFIYSAEDFVELIEDDPGVLSDWIGAKDVEIIDIDDDGERAGQPCTTIMWTLLQNSKSYAGELYIFDSQGDYGCYTVMTMVEEGCENEDTLYSQTAAMVDSFRITGPCQEDFTIQHSEELELDFALREGSVEGRIDFKNDHVLIVPVAPSFSHSSIRIQRDTVYKPAKDPVDRALEGCSHYYLEYKDNGHYISEQSPVEIGRYSFTGVNIQYTEDSEEHVACVVLFPYDDAYWKVTMIASESNLEATQQVLGDVLASLRLGDDTGAPAKGDSGADGKADNNKIIDEILTKIEGTEGFIQPDKYYQPLASFTDIDGNGVYELVAAYKVKVKNRDGYEDFKALYDVYTVKDGKYTAIQTGFDLYTEVGGNSGTVGLVVDTAKRPCLKVETRAPQADRFNDTVVYYCWNSDQSGFDQDQTFWIERHGTYGEEEKGEYILGGTKMSWMDYQACQDSYTSLWTDLDLNKGPGNGGNNMSFEQIRSLDMNTYFFNSVD